MSPMASWALGLGDIQVNSSLNQPLNAEIAVHSVTKKDLDSLRIHLAPKNIYSRANIERSDYLSRFRFKLIQRNGKNYVAITTRKPFREPFANFLIEASWSSGRLLREYTMLLDPPEFIKKHARPVTTATASRSSQVKRTESKSTRSVSAASKSSYTTSSSTGEMSYGPTKRNDTLWNIANDMAPENVSVNQMMMALLRDNPEAFIGNNINNLKAGYVLRIKDRDSLNEISKSNSNQQVKEQYQSWKAARKQKTGANIVDRSDRSSVSTSTDGQLTLVAAGKTEDADMKGDLSAEAKQLKEKLSLAGEDLESKEIENQELRTRIKELEDLLQTKSSLVELKDESLAAMQRQKEMQAMDSQLESDVVIDTPTEIVTVDETAVEETMVDEAVTDEAIVEETIVDEAIADEKIDMTAHIDPSVELASDEKMPAEVEMPVSVDEIITVSDVTQPEPKPAMEPVQESKPKKVVAPEEEIVDMLLSEEMLPFTAGGGALFIGLLAWLGLRGRGKKEDSFEESILDSKLEGDESDFSVDDSQLVDSKTEVLASDTETSFLSDFSADDMESLQPDDTEADPISEADVFMVYGRYQQAEELLQSAIKTEPERLDYQLKLLEVYHGDNLKDSFAVQADVVKELLKKQNDDYELTSEWTKAKSWAEKLDIDIDMPDTFDESAAVDDISDDTQSLDESTDSELSLDDLSDELSLESKEVSLNEDSILGDADDSDDEFDLSLDDSLEGEEELTLDEVDEETSEFSLDDSQLEDNKDDSDDEFNLSLEELDTDEGATELDLDESTLNLDDSLELEDDSLELEDDSLELEDDSLELEDDVDNSLATEGDELDLLDDDDLDFDDLEDDFPELDAVGTKLDLAKAYIDMGDMESASSILNEVIDEGDEEQKSQAQSLLDQTGS